LAFIIRLHHDARSSECQNREDPVKGPHKVPFFLWIWADQEIYRSKLMNC